MQWIIFEFLKNDMTAIPPLTKKFDMICLFSVFTHIFPNEMVSMLRNLKNHLKPNGAIVASALINPSLLEYTGGREKIEYNPDYFKKTVKSAGYTKIILFTKETSGQLAFKITR